MEHDSMKTFHFVLMAFAALGLSSCGGGRGYQPTLYPSMAGQWEFVAASTQTPGIQTNVETNLQQPQTLVNGVYQPTNTLSAAGSQQITFLGVAAAAPNQVPNITFVGNCPGSGANSITGTIDANYNVSLSYSQNGNVFNANGTLSSDHKSILGTYTSQAGSACNDSGTFIGTSATKLGGMYTGALCPPGASSCQFPQEATDNATATVSQSGSTVTVNMVLTGQDNTSFSLTGPVTGNAFSVQGTFSIGGQPQTVTYDGYYELTFDCVTQAVDLPSLYLVNTAVIGSGNLFGQVALLTVPVNQVCPSH
jgi:hypothetical protein